ncbi:hypothetical protein ACQWU4_04215 [Chryseobacterium sp. MIQD13]|uniref:hypothetical protein n=1 Tax=Chryseobacterium sp. MIQD13 TaxID=3422310 RepID=UPI003D296BB8
MKSVNLLILLCSTLFFAQKDKKSIDSLYAIINNKDAFAKYGEEELLRLCTELYYHSKESGNEPGQLNALTKMVRIYSEADNQGEVLKRMPEALAMAEKLEDYGQKSALLNYEGRAFIKLGFYDRAKTIIDDGLRTANKIPDSDTKYIWRSQLYGATARCIEDSSIDVAQHKQSLFYSVQKAYNEAKKIGIKNPERNRFLGERARILGSINIAFLQMKEGKQYLLSRSIIAETIRSKTFGAFI